MWKSSKLCHPAVKYSHATCDVLECTLPEHPRMLFSCLSTTVYHRKNDLGGPELHLAAALEAGKSKSRGLVPDEGVAWWSIKREQRSM